MIGVVTSSGEETLVREFFELFKTPWEFYRARQSYDVVLCASCMPPPQLMARLVLVYAGTSTELEEELKVDTQLRRNGAELSVWETILPIYGEVVLFRRGGIPGFVEKDSGGSVSYVDLQRNIPLVRIGYDLFAEIRLLLTKGQPIRNAGIPTLDLHIACLREVITGCGIALFEIPPVPEEHHFIGCLTHDVDFGAIRAHGIDATMAGFLYRATLGSAVDFARGRLPGSKLIANLLAVAKLPLVFLGYARDFWYDFDGYLEIEAGKPSTFFFLPFPGRPGRIDQGNAPKARACRYDVSELEPKISRLMEAGCEISLHGIDAWLESSSGLSEARRISQISGTPALGVRMHWLYSDERTTARLDEAGFSYDSTLGYNETVGYRAGTVQVFKPLNSSHLLEIPMLVMDTAMFYSKRLNLSATEGWQIVEPVLDNASRHGGVLTVNWHDRSIAPERLWGDFYARLVEQMALRGAWFATGCQVVSWFRKRRSARFERTRTEGYRITVGWQAETDEPLPGLRLRCYPPRQVLDFTVTRESRCIDMAFDGTLDFDGRTESPSQTDPSP